MAVLQYLQGYVLVCYHLELYVGARLMVVDNELVHG
jgi:hypothetical protein